MLVEAESTCTVYGMPRRSSRPAWPTPCCRCDELADAIAEEAGALMRLLRRSPDDYHAFCEGVRGLSGIDLLQYKRGQMERRIRSFAERRGHAGLGALPDVLRRDAAELERSSTA